jgi:hypothetical protein
MALGELGRCKEAVEWQRKMIAQAKQHQGNEGLLAQLEIDLQRYEKGTPCRAPGIP